MLSGSASKRKDALMPIIHPQPNNYVQAGYSLPKLGKVNWFSRMRGKKRNRTKHGRAVEWKSIAEKKWAAEKLLQLQHHVRRSSDRKPIVQGFSKAVQWDLIAQDASICLIHSPQPSRTCTVLYACWSALDGPLKQCQRPEEPQLFSSESTPNMELKKKRSNGCSSSRL